MSLQEDLGKTIIRLRKEKGYSQEAFANETGVDRRYMGDIENGKRNISISRPISGTSSSNVKENTEVNPKVFCPNFGVHFC